MRITKPSKKLVAVIVIAVGVAVVYGVKTIIGGSDISMFAGSRGKVKGVDNAPVKIIEFIDFECPACAQGARYLTELMGNNPELIRLQIKHYPLQMHRHGMISAEYAECASRQGKFWEFHDLLVERQGNWKQLPDARPAFEQMAQEVSLDLEDINACVEGGGASARIAKDQAEGRALGIRSTPTYFVNGEMIVGKNLLESKIKIIQQEQGD